MAKVSSLSYEDSTDEKILPIDQGSIKLDFQQLAIRDGIPKF